MIEVAVDFSANQVSAVAVSSLNLEVTIPNTISYPVVSGGLTTLSFTNVNGQEIYDMTLMGGYSTGMELLDIVAVKKGNLFIDPSQYQKTGTDFEFLSDLLPIDGGEHCIIFLK